MAGKPTYKELEQRIKDLERYEIERKRAEEAFRRQREELQIILDSVPAMVFYKDKENRFLRVNEATAQTFGLAKEDLEGTSLFDVLPEQADVYWKDDKEVMESGRPKTGIIETIETSKGLRWHATDKIPYRDEKGDITGVIGFAVDIDDRIKAEEALKKAHEELERRVEERTNELSLINRVLRREIEERKQIEKALRESEETARVLLNAPYDMAALMDTDGKILAINEAGARSFGKRTSELTGMCIYDLFRPDVAGYRKAQAEKAIRLKEPLQFEDQDRDRWFKQNLYPILDTRGEVTRFAAFTRNITQRKQAEAALKESEKELKIKTSRLEEINTALKVLIEKREEDRARLGEDVLSNIRELVQPYLERLRESGLDSAQGSLVDVLESNLREITAPLTRAFSSGYLSFTPTEIRIANLVKQGKTSKEIAELIDSTKWTVDFHRNNIRKKLGIHNRKINLRSRLLTIG